MVVGVSVVPVPVPVQVLHRVSFFLQPTLFVAAARRLRAGWMRVFTLILAL